MSKILRTYRVMQVSVTLVLLLAGSNIAHAQAYRFSQFYAAPLYLNPALSGLENKMYAGINHRTQQQANVKFHTSQASFIYPVMLKGPVNRHIGGAGITLLRDAAGIAGELVTNGVSLSYAHNLKLDFYGVNHLVLGLQGSYYQQRVETGNFTWGSQVTAGGFNRDITPAFSRNVRANGLGVNAGLVWVFNSKNMRYRPDLPFSSYLGFAAANLNQPSMSFTDASDPLPIQYKIHGGANVQLSRKFSVQPSAMVLNQEYLTQVDVGAFMVFKHEFKSNVMQNTTRIQLHTGAWHRLNNAFIILLGASNGVFSTAVSYDTNSFTPGSTASGTAFELSLSYKIQQRSDVKRVSTPLF
jgi:type IX secretion system PorP/SprF family membrane protein